MNKLVSKNPIQRFKEGKQIKKFQNPSQPIYLMDNNRNKYQLNSDGKYYRTNGSDAFSSGKTAKEINNTKKGQIAISEKSAKIPLGGIAAVKKSIYNRKPSDSKNYKDIGNKSKGTGNTLSYQFGKMGGWNRFIGERTIDDLESVKMIKEMGLSGSAEDIQNKINEEFGSNAVRADNKWGNQSKTGLKALYKKWKENQNVVPEPIVRYPSTINPTYTPPTTPINQEVANLNLNIPQQTYDRTGIREFIRNKGINPYSFSGAQRRALRMVLNNTADDNDKLLVKGMGLFKKGGQLLSRNPVERFKNNINKN